MKYIRTFARISAMMELILTSFSSAQVFFFEYFFSFNSFDVSNEKYRFSDDSVCAAVTKRLRFANDGRECVQVFFYYKWRVHPIELPQME